MKRIFIAIPVYQYAECQCIESVINLTQTLKNKYDFVIKFISGYAVDQARNIACKEFMQSQCDYLFFVDGDIIVTEQAFEKLMEIDKDIATAVYNKKSLLTKETTICIIDDKQNFVTMLQDQIKPETFKIMGCGFGCVLIKRDVIRILMDKCNGTPFKYISGIPDISEDIYFCNECSKYNIEVWCDGTAKVGHIGKFLY